MASALQSIILLAHVFVGWLGLLGFFVLFKDLPRTLFTVWHYVAVVLIYTLVFYVYYTFFNQATPFITMVFALLALFFIEFIVYGFLYQGDLWFLNPLDWLGSVILFAIVVYSLGFVLAK